MSEEYAINVIGLTKLFNDRVVVNGIDLRVKKGEIFGFLGPNGSGKTTTIRMLCGLLTPDAGYGNCLGYNVLTESEKIKRQVGYMTQSYSLYIDMTVEENLNFIAGLYNLPNPKKQVQAILEKMRLTACCRQLTGNLSGGWKQRVALACCLLHEPDLLLLDEPTAGIDPIARRDFWENIQLLSDQGVTTLMSTHYMDEAERCNRLAYIANSNLIVTGSVRDVIESTGLMTWELRGNVGPKLLQRIKTLDGVLQAELFGSRIHACGTNSSLIEKELADLQLGTEWVWERIQTTLEDAFISLVKKSQGEAA